MAGAVISSVDQSRHEILNGQCVRFRHPQSGGLEFLHIRMAFEISNAPVN